ncbi:large ribosomal subunit protein bL12m-like isoform X2 [Amphiura filiformis]|uniref:large ribosomal subunit protein bL12m-like isoform X2 n=1 Tax=Amphiura filiformis TaxID=82378 RepID=UPI003B20F731
MEYDFNFTCNDPTNDTEVRELRKLIKMFIICRTCIPFRAVRQLSRCCIYQQSLSHTRQQMPVISSVRHCSVASEALSPPGRDGEEKQYPQKIQQVVDQISGLTLLEVADLNELLKKTLNIQDAPVMAAGMAMAPAQAKQANEDAEEDESAAKQVQTSFTIKLLKFDEKNKVKLIKEIKALSANMNLVQAKKFVESIPAVVKADIGKDEAEKIKEQVEKAGGECVIE